MQIKYLHTHLFVLISLTVFGQIKPRPKDLNTHGNGLTFTENRGQLVDSKKQQRPDILFKGNGGGTDVYLRKTGVSYVSSNGGEISKMINEKIERLKATGKPTDMQEQRRQLSAGQVLKIHRWDVDFVNANPDGQIVTANPISGYTSYYYPQCPQGITHVPSYNTVTQKNIYRNVDVKYYGGKSSGLKYDIVVNPGGNPSDIQLKYSGAEKLELHYNRLYIKTSLGEMEEYMPKVYQNINGEIVDVKAEYSLKSLVSGTEQHSAETANDSILHTKDYEISFQLGAYNHEQPLIIDPWATYYGGSGADYSLSVAADKDNSGDVLITGATHSTDLPVLAGGYSQPYTGGDDAFVAKFDAAGSRLWAVYYGGSSDDVAFDVTTDIPGNVIISGYTKSADFPVLAAGGYSQAFEGLENVFVVKFNSGGALLWSSYYGGSAYDYGQGVATTNAGDIILTGYTGSSDFPIAGGGYTQTFGGMYDGFIVKFNSAGTRLWSTFIGGVNNDYCYGVTTDSGNNILITGNTASTTFPIVTAGGYSQAFTGSSDAFVVKFNPAGTILWSTLYGGGGEAGYSIATDNSDNILITGITGSINFPVFNAYQATYGSGSFGEAFLVKFNSSGVRQFATYYGNKWEIGYDVAADANNNVYLLLETEDSAPNLFIIPDTCSYNPAFNGGSSTDPSGGEPEDQLVVKFNPAGQKLCSTYIGGAGEDDLDCILGNSKGIDIRNNAIFISGSTDGGFPTTTGAFQTSFDGPYANFYSGGSDAYLTSICTNICEGKKVGVEFYANATNVCNNTPITFTPVISSSCDTSGYKFLWTFAGGTPATSTAASPVVNYATQGTYDVKLVVTTECQKDSITKPAYIKIDPCAFTLSAPGGRICMGSCIDIPATPSGGTAPYTYSWSNGATTSSIHVCPTTSTSYSVLVTDALGKQASTGSSVAVSSITVNVTGIDNSCSVSGSASASASGGASPYTYVWSNGQTGVTISCPSAGTYSVTATDAIGCATVQTIAINNSSPVSATFTQSPTGTVCTGTTVYFTNTGSSGAGISPYWAIVSGTSVTSGITTDYSYTFLTAGSYSVQHRVTDGSGCQNTVNSTVNVIDCSAPTVAATGNIICSGSCATVASTPSGGTAPYTYLWSTGATTQNIMPCPLNTTTYTVTITDAGSHTATTTATVTVNPVVSVAVTPTNINCFGGNGSVIANGSAGTSPYSYSWNNTQTTQTISNLTVGNYTVTITDSKGCTSTSSAAVTQPNAIIINPITANSATCGSSNGSAVASASGGTGTLSYSWSSTQTGVTASNLAAGSYTVTVTDANACTTSLSVNINNTGSGPSVKTISATSNVSCNGGNNGIATVNINGGAPSFTYSWSTGIPSTTSATSDQQINLPAGTYTVTITDVNGCKAIGNISITEPPALTLPAITPVNATCGNSNGSAVASSSGGTGALTYTWSNLASGATTSGLTTGTYTVTVKDANGCTITNTVAINNSGGPSISSVTVTNPLCSSGSGTAVANASGGTGTLTYTWSNAAAGITVNALANGTYTVTVKDANGCANTSAVSVIVPPAITLTASQNAPASCGNNNGIAVTTPATGGTGSFTYLWSNGSTGLTASILSSGTYIVTATDGNGCTATSTAIINNNPSPVINSITPAPLLCNGGSNASAVVSATGTATLTYTWTNGNSGVTSTNLSAGTFYVTVTDGNGCNAISSVAITSPAAINLNPVTSVNASCGLANGSANASATGGTGSLTYSWSSLASGQTASGLSAGPYTLTVTDANNCSVTTSVVVGSSGGPVIQTTTPVNELCNGNSTGSAAVSISGGASPYTYSWSNGASSITISLNNSITSLPANTYVVTITDKNGCTATASFNITEPASISTPVITPTNASCGASDGSAVASSSGGTGSLTYSWSNLASGQTASGLSSATYTVSVTDANGCAVSKTVAIGNNGGPSVQSTTPVNELCNGSSTGSASVTISGGAAPYTYSWSNAVSSITTSLTNSITSVPANTYIVTIADNNNCSTTTSIIITEPSAITMPSTSSVNSTCGNANGSATALSSGGTGTLTYSWSSGAAGQTATNLLVQTYTVSVTDANNCAVTKTVTIGNDNAPLASLNVTSAISCNGGTGSITATATGGNPNYTYSWSNSISSVTTGLQATLNNLTSAIYTVTITDVSGCSHTSSILLTEPSAVLINSVTPVNSNCGSATGSAVASASGGTGSLTYTWNNFVSGTMDSGLAAGTYTVTVTDANACSTSQTVTINNNGGPVINSITPTDELCHGASTGSASVNISGGASPYTYAWSAGATQITTNTQSTINSQQSGNYSVTITDANSCQIVSTVTITEPSVIAISTTPVNAICGSNNGSITASASGGTGSLTYSWSNFVSGQTNAGLVAGTYIVTVTDANACSNTQSVSVNNSPAPVIAGFTLTSVKCNGANTGTAVVSASGTSALTYNWSAAGASGQTANNLTAGTYTVTVTDASGCQQISVTTIVQPTAIAITNINSTTASCNKNDGTATAAASGGAGALTYSWSNLASGSTDTGMAAGNYTLTVTDANGCAITNTVTINSINGPTAATAISGSIKCNGQTGSITATASNGTAPYTYSWSTGATSVTTGLTSQISNLVSATYIVTIIDKNGCASTSSIDLTQPATLTVTAVGQPSSCGGNNGIATAVAGGGSIAYTYSWSNDSLKAGITNLNPATYTVTVTDANGCSQTTTVAIAGSVGVVASIASSQTTIVEGNSTILIGGGGTSYSWTPSGSLSCGNCATPTATPGSTTTYTLYITDGSNCTDSANITITVKKACSGTDGDIYIANIFSPNNDGKNDVLNIEGNAITNIYWAIYDRWGNLLFETSDQAQGWDGTKNGNPMEAGTYVYYLKAICIKTKAEVKLKGNVSIVK